MIRDLDGKGKIPNLDVRGKQIRREKETRMLADFNRALGAVSGTARVEITLIGMPEDSFDPNRIQDAINVVAYQKPGNLSVLWRDFDSDTGITIQYQSAAQAIISVARHDARRLFEELLSRIGVASGEFSGSRGIARFTVAAEGTASRAAEIPDAEEQEPVEGTPESKGNPKLLEEVVEGLEFPSNDGETTVRYFGTTLFSICYDGSAWKICPDYFSDESHAGFFDTMWRELGNTEYSKEEDAKSVCREFVTRHINSVPLQRIREAAAQRNIGHDQPAEIEHGQASSETIEKIEGLEILSAGNTYAVRYFGQRLFSIEPWDDSEWEIINHTFWEDMEILNDEGGWFRAIRKLQECAYGTAQEAIAACQEFVEDYADAGPLKRIKAEQAPETVEEVEGLKFMRIANETTVEYFGIRIFLIHFPSTVSSFEFWTRKELNDPGNFDFFTDRHALLSTRYQNSEKAELACLEFVKKYLNSPVFQRIREAGRKAS